MTVDIDELHGLVANETRMRIMQVLWDEFDFERYVIEEQEAVPFSTLRERARVDDSGNFNYHLSQLADTLVENFEDGYVLTPLGYNLMQSIERYATFEYETREEWTVDDSCPFCGGALTARYRREMLEVRCTDCGGLADGGHFTFAQLSSTGTRDLSAPEFLDAATQVMGSKIRSSMYGSCWNCHARMDIEFHVCGDHDAGFDGTCPECTHRYRSKVDVSCPSCGTAGHGPVLEYAILSPVVGSFFNDAGHGPTQMGPWQYRLTALGAATEAVVSTDPLAVEVTFEFREHRLQVVVEEDLSGITVSRDLDSGSGGG